MHTSLYGGMTQQRVQSISTAVQIRIEISSGLPRSLRLEPDCDSLDLCGFRNGLFSGVFKPMFFLCFRS